MLTHRGFAKAIPKARRVGWAKAQSAVPTTNSVGFAALSPPYSLPVKRGEVKRRKAHFNHCPRHANKCCHSSALRARKRIQRDALAFRRSTAALAKFLGLAQPRAAFPGITECGRVFGPPRSQCSGHPARRSLVPAELLPRAARVRGYESRPREPLLAPLPDRL